MMTQRFLPGVRRGVASVAIGMLLICRSWSAEPKPDVSSAQLPTKQLVRLMLESEVAGHNDQREALLQQANRPTTVRPIGIWGKCVWAMPGCRRARFSGPPRKISGWSAIGVCVKRPAQRLPIRLRWARWCRKNKLVHEERVHWLFVRQLQPDHPEAIKALGLPLSGDAAQQRPERKAQGADSEVEHGDRKLAAASSPMAESRRQSRNV